MTRFAEKKLVREQISRTSQDVQPGFDYGWYGWDEQAQCGAGQ